MKKTINHFSLEKAYKGKVPVVGMVVKDAEAEETGSLIAMLSISMMYDGRLVEANIPLDDTPDFKRHILSIITQASRLKPETDTAKKEIIINKAIKEDKESNG